MKIPAYIYLRCEKCGANHGRERLPLTGQINWYESHYEHGPFAIPAGTLTPEKCQACGALAVTTYFETNEFSSVPTVK